MIWQAIRTGARAARRGLARDPSTVLRRSGAHARALLRGLGDLALPPHCAGCGSPAIDPRTGPLCDDCAAALPWLDADPCFGCRTASVREEGALCEACRAGPDADLSGCLAAVAYTPGSADWIQRFKYPESGLRALDGSPCAVVASLVRDAAAGLDPAAIDLVVPIPLHRRRLRERGFNPAALLAREVARSLGTPLATGLLARVRDTPSQTGLGHAARRRNVSKAFDCRGRPPDRVVVVDDVVTTGATLREAARALRSAGARDVQAVCVARTPAPR